MEEVWLSSLLMPISSGQATIMSTIDCSAIGAGPRLGRSGLGTVPVTYDDAQRLKPLWVYSAIGAGPKLGRCRWGTVLVTYDDAQSLELMEIDGIDRGWVSSVNNSDVMHWKPVTLVRPVKRTRHLSYNPRPCRCAGNFPGFRSEGLLASQTYATCMSWRHKVLHSGNAVLAV